MPVWYASCAIFRTHLYIPDGFRRVTIPQECITISAVRSELAVMPSMHLVRSVLQAFVITLSEVNSAKGDDRLHNVKLKLTSRCRQHHCGVQPPNQEARLVCYFRDNGLTLPGIMEEPVAIGGRLISARPQRGLKQAVECHYKPW